MNTPLDDYVSASSMAINPVGQLARSRQNLARTVATYGRRQRPRMAQTGFTYTPVEQMPGVRTPWEMSQEELAQQREEQDAYASDPRWGGVSSVSDYPEGRQGPERLLWSNVGMPGFNSQRAKQDWNLDMATRTMRAGLGGLADSAVEGTIGIPLRGMHAAQMAAEAERNGDWQAADYWREQMATSAAEGATALTGAGLSRSISQHGLRPSADELGIFGGRYSRRADMDALDEAQRRVNDPANNDAMSTRNRTRTQTYRDTGWFLDEADGQWKFEIDDSGWKLPDDVNEMFKDPDNFLDPNRPEGSTARMHRGRVTGRTAGELLGDIPLFEHYPHLRDVNVEIAYGRHRGVFQQPEYSNDVLGQPRRQQDLFGEPGQLRPAYIGVVAQDADDALDILAHELQHTVQKSSPGTAEGSNTRSPEVQARVIQPMLAERARLERERDAINSAIHRRFLEWRDAHPNATQAEVDDFIVNKNETDAETAQRADLAVRIAMLGDQRIDAAAYGAYRDVAGEVEARRAAQRRNLDADERLAMVPWREDVGQGPPEHPDVDLSSAVTDGEWPGTTWVGSRSTGWRGDGRPWSGLREPLTNYEREQIRARSDERWRGKMADELIWPVDSDSVDLVGAAAKAPWAPGQGPRAVRTMSDEGPPEEAVNTIPVPYEPEFDPYAVRAPRRGRTPAAPATPATPAATADPNPRAIYGHNSGDRYVGAPHRVRTPQAEAAARRRYIAAVQAGIEHADWYKNSGQTVRGMAGGDPERIRQLSDAIATTSVNTSVAGNTQFATRANNQVATGRPVSGMTEQVARATALALAGQGTGGGPKIEPFSQQLQVAAGAREPGSVRAVHDRRDARIWGYDEGQVDGGLSDTNHRWMDAQTEQVIQYLNANAVGGKTDWDTASAQAAAWATQDTGAGNADFSRTFQRNAAQQSRETAPGPSTRHLQGMAGAPREVRTEYDDRVRAILYDEFGNDRLAAGMGALPLGSMRSVGVYKGEINPGTQAFMATTVPPNAGARPTQLEDSSTELLNASEAGYGLLMGQDAIAWGRGLPSAQSKADIAHLSFGRQPTDDEVLGVIRSVSQFGDDIAVIPTPGGIRLLSTGAPNAKLQQVAGAISQQMGGTVRGIDWQHNAGNFEMNNWREPGGALGQTYLGMLDRLPVLGAKFDRIAPDIAHRLIDVDADFSREFGFTLSPNIMKMREAVATGGRAGLWKLARTMGLSLTAGAALVGAAEAMELVPPAGTPARGMGAGGTAPTPAGAVVGRF